MQDQFINVHLICIDKNPIDLLVLPNFFRLQRAAWSRVFISIATRTGTVAALSGYLNGRGGSSLESAGRGVAVFGAIIAGGRLNCDPFLQCLVGMTNPDTTPFPWGDNLPKCQFVQSLTTRYSSLVFELPVFELLTIFVSSLDYKLFNQ